MDTTTTTTAADPTTAFNAERESAWAKNILVPKMMNLSTSDEDIIEFTAKLMTDPNVSEGRRLLLQQYFQKRQQMIQAITMLIQQIGQTARDVIRRFA